MPLITPREIAPRANLRLRNNLIAASMFPRDHQDAWAGKAIGQTVDVRIPSVFPAEDYGPKSLQNPRGKIAKHTPDESKAQLTIERWPSNSVEINDKALALELDSFSEQILYPLVDGIAQDIDAYVLSKVPLLANHYTVSKADLAGDDGWDKLVDAREVMQNAMIPLGTRIGILNPTGEAALLKQDNFVRSDYRGDGGMALRTGFMGRVLGIDFYMDQNVKQATQAAKTGWLVNGSAVAQGATAIPIDGGSTDPVAGDIFTIANDEQPYLVESYASNVLTIKNKGGLKKAPADNAALTIAAIAEGGRNFLGDPRAIQIAQVPLPSLGNLVQIGGVTTLSGAESATMPSVSGIPLRVSIGTDIDTKTMTLSVDCLIGADATQPELATQLIITG